MILHALVGGVLLGIALILGVSALAVRNDKRKRKQVLGKIKDKLTYEGKVNRLRVKRENKRKTKGAHSG